jgi:hypothetical protein
MRTFTYGSDGVNLWRGPIDGELTSIDQFQHSRQVWEPRGFAPRANAAEWERPLWGGEAHFALAIEGRL